MSEKEKFLINFIKKHGKTLAVYCKDFPFPKKLSFELHVSKHAWKHYSPKLTH